MAAPALDRSAPPAPGPLRPFHFPDVERLTLSNGVPLWVAPVHHFPVVTWSVLLEAGGMHEPAERAGVAALTAELLESGAGERSAAELAEQIEGLGVELHSTATWDMAHGGITALRARVEPAIEILADLVRRPTFPDDEVERLRAERLAEILQRRAEPRALAGEMAARFLFSPGSPYARPLAGTPESVAALARPEVVSFHARRFAAGAAFVVAGDLRPQEARALAERHFGDWQVEPAPPPALRVEPRSRVREVVLIDRPGSVQSELRVGHVGVARSTPDYFPLVVMNTVLGGAFSSRLNLNLREQKGYTYGVHSGFAMRRAPGPFVVSTAVQTEVTAPAVAEIVRELAGMRAEPVSPAELTDARTYVAGAFPLRLQTTDGLASRLSELIVYGLPADYFADYRERILAVEAADVLRAAREHLRPEELTIVVVGDSRQVRGPLQALGLGPVTVYDKEGNPL